MYRPMKLLAAVTLGVIYMPAPAANAGFSLSSTVQVTSDNTGGVVNYNPSNTTFTTPGGNGVVMENVAYQAVDTNGKNGNGNVSQASLIQIKIVSSSGSGSSGSITIGNMTGGSFDSMGSMINLTNAFTPMTSATFLVDSTTFTYLGFLDGNGKLVTSLPVTSDSATFTAEFSYVNNPAVVPEPSSALLVALGLAGAAFAGASMRRRQGRGQLI